MRCVFCRQNHEKGHNRMSEKELKDIRMSFKMNQRQSDYLDEIAKKKGLSKSAALLLIINKAQALSL